MFKWPRAPSPRASEHELADYAELKCWEQGSTSLSDIGRTLGGLEENDYYSGVPEEDAAPQAVEAAFVEIERRQEACAEGYPFVLRRPGSTLHMGNECDNKKCIVYHYLLLATRLDMANDRVHGGVDGTVLFEELSGEAAREYFGNRAESVVFGTAAGAGGFPARVNELCQRLREGGGYKSMVGNAPHPNDGKLDIAVWKSFRDDLPGKLIGFGQCKTGTNYRDHLTQLQPDAFCKKWMLSAPALDPVRMFFVSEALARSRWYDHAADAGLLFDRCRVIDFCDKVREGVFARVTSWTEAASRELGLPWPW